MRRNAVIISSLVLLLAPALMADEASAQSTVTLNYTWSAPSTGSPVDHYVIQHSVNGGPYTTVGTSATNTYALTATVGDAHRIRVAGVDDQDRQGPYSLPSESYTPDIGPPGQPGQPVIF